VLVCFFACLFSSAGQTFLIGLYIDPLIKALGADRVAISSVYSLATLAAAFAIPLMGLLADCWSSRWYFATVFLLIGLALAGLAGATSLVVVGCMFFVLRLMGQGAVQVGAIRTTADWFQVRSGRAVALVMLGFAFGELLLPGLVARIIEGWGWRESLLLGAAFYLLVAVPGALLTLRARRAEDGDEILVENGRPEGPAYRREPIPLQYNLPFWLLLMGTSLHPFVMTGLFFHNVAITEDLGWDFVSASAMISAFAVGRIAFSYLSGPYYERCPAEWHISHSSLILGAGCLTVLLPVPAPVAPLLYGGVLGISAGISATGNSLLWQSRYGVTGLGRLQGTVNAFRNGGTAAAPPVAALIATTGVGFVAIPVWAAALCAIVAAIPWLIRATIVEPRALEANPAAVG
jgi:MFS family permease